MESIAKYVIVATGLLFSVLTAFTPSTQAQGGLPLWTNRSKEGGSAIAVNSSGSVFLTGASTNSNSGYDYSTVAYSSAGVPLWTNRYNGPGNGNDGASDIAVDESGNVLVTGSSVGSDGTADFATIKYSGGGEPLWTNRYGGLTPLDEGGRAVGVDTNGNVFVTGPSSDGTNFASYGFVTVAYSSAGVPLWTNHLGGPGSEACEPLAMAVHGSGNVFVTGYSWDGINPESTDYATVAYSSAGAPLWTNRYNGPDNDIEQPNGIAVSADGKVFVTGYSYGDASSYDYATVAYSSAGVPLWTNRYTSNGPGNIDDYANDVTVDHTGNVFVTGSSGGDYATVAYSGAGMPLWTNRYNGGASAVVVDSIGNVFVTGTSWGGILTSVDFATVAYSGAGVALWTNRYNGTGNSIDYGHSLAADSRGNVFVTGTSDGDYITIKYSSSVPTPVRLGIEPDGSGGYFIRFNGSLGFTYRLQRAAGLTGPWPDIATNTAPASGLVEFHDTNPPSSAAFYRTLQP